MHVILFNIASTVFQNNDNHYHKNTKCYINSNFILLYLILSMSARNNKV